MPGDHGLLRTAKRVLFVLRSLRGPARHWCVRRLLEGAAARAARLERARETFTPAGRLLFVCHGNIMRSAFATAVARQQVPQHAARVVGAGTHAKAGRPAQDSALRVADTLHAPLAGHTATPLHDAAPTPHDIVVCMDLFNEAHVLERYPQCAARVFLVGDVDPAVAHALREVRDPYGRADDVTADAFRRVQQLAERWASLLR